MANVLVIDDDESVRNLVRILLAMDGHNFTGATGGVSGLEMFFAQPSAYDLVITDLAMPDLHGEQVVGSLLADYPNLNILVFSGSGFEVDSGGGLDKIQDKFPMVNVMAKPFNAKEFRGKISQVLSAV